MIKDKIEKCMSTQVEGLPQIFREGLYHQVRLTFNFLIIKRSILVELKSFPPLAFGRILFSYNWKHKIREKKDCKWIKNLSQHDIILQVERKYLHSNLKHYAFLNLWAKNIYEQGLHLRSYKLTSFRKLKLHLGFDPLSRWLSRIAKTDGHQTQQLKKASESEKT